MMEFFSILSSSSVIPSTDASWKNEIPASMKRRDPRIWQMASVSAGRALVSGAPQPHSIIVGTALGALDETKNFLDGIFTDGFGSPKNFIASVHNSMAGRLAQEFKIHGPNLTVCDGPNSFASALALSSLLLANEFPVLVIAIDETIELLDRLAPHLSPPCQKVFGSEKREGSVAFIIDKKTAAAGPNIRSTGVRFIGDASPDQACRSCMIPREAASSRKIVLPSETDGSFLSVPILVHDFVSKKIPGDVLYGSFSPSSNSIAMVEVCIY
jgi:hypothetical protein